MNLKWMIPLLIGALIGYITNDIAIKMLFHPRKAHYIGKWRVPFTPGLIPKEKNRVARSIGNVISTQLLDSTTVIETLTSEVMVTRLRKKLEQMVDSNRNNKATVREVLARIAGEERVDELFDKFRDNSSELFYRKLTNMRFGETVSRMAFQKMKENLTPTVMVFMSGIFDEVSESIGDRIDHVIADNSEEIIRRMIDKGVVGVENMMICELIEQNEEKIPGYIDLVMECYKTAVRNHMKVVLEGIGLSKIVEDRVTSFDEIQLENMIFGIMDRELKAIVYLGALLGCLMGIVNLVL